jgi:integrase
VNNGMLKRARKSKAFKTQNKLYQENESIRYMLEGLKDSTAKQYLRYLPKVMDALHEATGLKTPDEILEARKEDMKSDDRKQRKRFEHICKTWYHRLYEEFEKEGKSTGSAWNYMRTAMAFFSRNDYPLKFRRGELRRVKRKIKGYIPIEDLKTAYGFIKDVRNRALFTVMLQSGLSPIDVCALDWELLIDKKTGELERAPIYIEGYREKTTSRYQTCLGDDAVVELKRLWILEDKPMHGAVFKTKFGKRIEPESVSAALTPTIKKVIPEFQVKMLRDIYHVALERARIGKDVLNRMFGHEIVGAGSEYPIGRFTVIENYQRAIVYLRVNGFIRRKAADVATDELILKLGKIVAIMATEGRESAINSMTNLIGAIKGAEAAKKIDTHEDRVEGFVDALATYLRALRTE